MDTGKIGLAASRENTDAAFQHETIERLTKELAVARQSAAQAHRDLDRLIADHATATAAREKSEHRFRAFAEIASDWLWEMDADLRFTFFSEGYYEASGIKPEDVIGTARDTFVGRELSKQDAENWKAHYKTLAARKPFKNFEYSSTTPQGAVRHFRTSGVPKFSDEGEFEGYFGTGSNITTAVETRRQMNRDQKRLIDAVETMSDALALFDPDDRLVFCNDRFKQLNPDLSASIRTGMTFEEMLRDNIRHDRIVEAIGREEEYIRDRLAQHRDPKAPILSQRSDGRWLLVKEERSPDGSTFLINSDLTALKQREEALQHAKEAAERASRHKSEFLAKMSHELRTPLNAVIGFSDVMQRELFGPLDNEQYQSYARDIHFSGQHLLDLINDVLDLAKIESGKYKLNIRDVDLAAMVRDSRRLVRTEIGDKKLQVRTLVEDGLPSIEADERAVRQILINLLTNAVKFTQEGGRIRVRAARAGPDRVRIVVYDNGIGIPESETGMVLSPFAQIGLTDHATGGGVGLGLSIVDSLVRLHNGTLTIKSALGDWTRVTVEIPVRHLAAEGKS